MTTKHIVGDTVFIKGSKKMIIEIPEDNSIVKWKYKDKDEWKVAEISDLIKAYERPQGEWWNMQDDDLKIADFKCSICNYWSDGDYNYCPNCGADMRKGGVV